VSSGFFYTSRPGPTVSRIDGNEGAPGTPFFLFGDGFSEGGFSATVCGVPAESIVIDDEHARVVAPDCAQSGWAAIEVCTGAGCVEVAEGFRYSGATPEGLRIDSVYNHRGLAGTEFFVEGLGFAAPDLEVRLCGGAVAALVLSDTDLVLLAPGCGETGWVPIEICTAARGCVARAEGFFYESRQPRRFLRGDANNDLVVDVSDAIAVLLEQFSGVPGGAPCADASDFNDDGLRDITDAVTLLAYLFLENPPAPKAPFEEPGVDPTPDSLPPCFE
jgi:hypothetical protein